MNKNNLKQTYFFLGLALLLLCGPILFKLLNKDEVKPKNLNTNTSTNISYQTILTNSGKHYTGELKELTKEELKSIRDVVNQPYLFTPMAYQTMWPVDNDLCKSPSIIEENFNLKLYTACNDLSKQQGLKMVKDIPDNQGMLFIYNEEQVLNFWMNQTYSPLSIAYLDKDFKVVHVAEMIPLDKTNISSIVPAKYALELKKGMMKKLGIEKGVVLNFKPSLEKLSFIPDERIEDQDYEIKLFMQYHNQ